jgi:hypothetical protein
MTFSVNKKYGGGSLLYGQVLPLDAIVHLPLLNSHRVVTLPAAGGVPAIQHREQSAISSQNPEECIHLGGWKGHHKPGEIQ